jgi:hypothetical protein
VISVLPILTAGMSHPDPDGLCSDHIRLSVIAHGANRLRNVQIAAILRKASDLAVLLVITRKPSLFDDPTKGALDGPTSGQPQSPAGGYEVMPRTALSR